MKYKPKDYINSGFYDGGMGDDDIENEKVRVVKCRKPHKCMGGCDSEIKAGEHALLETGFMDGKPVSCHTCLPCIDKWLDEINGDESEEEEDDC
jgi:hypothetical protein